MGKSLLEIHTDIIASDPATLSALHKKFPNATVLESAQEKFFNIRTYQVTHPKFPEGELITLHFERDFNGNVIVSGWSLKDSPIKNSF